MFAPSGLQLPAVEVSSGSDSDDESPAVFSSGRFVSKTNDWVGLPAAAGGAAPELPSLEEEWTQPQPDTLQLAQAAADRDGTQINFPEPPSPVLPRGSSILAAQLTDVLPDTPRRSPGCHARDQSPSKLSHMEHGVAAGNIQFDNADSPCPPTTGAAAAAVPAEARRAPVLSLDNLLTDADLEDLLHRLRTGTADLGFARPADTPSAASTRSSISPSPREAPLFSYQPRWARQQQHDQQQHSTEDSPDAQPHHHHQQQQDEEQEQGAQDADQHAEQQLLHVQQQHSQAASAAEGSSGSGPAAGGASSSGAGRPVAKVWCRDHPVQLDLRGGGPTSCSTSTIGTTTSHKTASCSTSTTGTTSSTSSHKTASCSTSTTSIQADHGSSSSAAGRATKSSSTIPAAWPQAGPTAHPGSTSSSKQVHVQSLTEGLTLQQKGQQRLTAAHLAAAAGRSGGGVADGSSSDSGSDSSAEEWRRLRQQRRRAAGQLVR